MEAAMPSEKSVSYRTTTRHHIPLHLDLNLHRRQYLISRNDMRNVCKILDGKPEGKRLL
jgi:hypothetical protein